jgi:hypothetical protein
MGGAAREHRGPESLGRIPGEGGMSNDVGVGIPDAELNAVLPNLALFRPPPAANLTTPEELPYRGADGAATLRIGR